MQLFVVGAVARALTGADAVLHLAARIPRRERYERPEAWAENDRLRTGAARVLVDAGSPCAWGCSTGLAPVTTSRLACTASRCTWPTANAFRASA
jgi:hypothetical protein